MSLIPRNLDQALFFETIAFIDEQLAKLWAVIYPEDFDPDGPDGDRVDLHEYVVGLGFIACQRYLISVLGPADSKTKERCLDLGPRTGVDVGGDQPLARVLHAVGNFAKHGPEEELAKRTREVLERFDVLYGAGRMATFPCYEVLLDLTPRGRLEPSFAPLLPKIAAWRETVLSSGLLL